MPFIQLWTDDRNRRRYCESAVPLLLCLTIATGWPSRAVAEADGPDFWRIENVAEHDSLNIRMGPGTQFPVIGAFAPDARGLQAITCVPLYTIAQYQALSQQERSRLPPRWCLVFGRDGQKGWVAQRFLAEDVTSTGREDTDGASVAASEPPAGVSRREQQAVDLVTDLYALGGASARGGNPLVDRPQRFFFADVARNLRSGRVGADPLYGTQDADISDLRIGLDPNYPSMRGMIIVVARFRNFGQQQSALLRLRADPQQDGALRIFSIEHEGWSFP